MDSSKILDAEKLVEEREGIDAGLYNFVLKFYNTNDNANPYYSYAALRKCWNTMDRITASSEIETGINTQAKLIYTFVHLGNTVSPELKSQDVINFAIEYFNTFPHPFSKPAMDSLFSYLGKDETIVNLLINDALSIVNFTDEFEERMMLLRMEWSQKYNSQNTDIEWHELTLNLLKSAKLYLPYSKTYFENDLFTNILRLDKKVSKSKAKLEAKVEVPEVETKKGFQHIEKNSPSRGTQTYFRTAYSNHIQLSAIADNKAHIMISVNSILISVLISMMTYKSLTDYNPIYLLPILLFLISALTSLIFAVISAKPKVLSPGANNLVFFNSFSKLSQEEFEKEVEEMFKDTNTLYSNMVRGIHDIGMVLERKYASLRYSYNVFMFGFITTVITFLYAYFNG